MSGAVGPGERCSGLVVGAAIPQFYDPPLFCAVRVPAAVAAELRAPAAAGLVAQAEIPEDLEGHPEEALVALTWLAGQRDLRGAMEAQLVRVAAAGLRREERQGD